MQFKAIGKIYQAGANPHVENLYPKVAPGPVPLETPHPVWEWNHDDDWFVIDWKEEGERCNGPSTSYDIDPFKQDSPDAYILDHIIDGRVLFPFAGYLELVWKTLCKLNGKNYQTTSVVIENIKLHG